LTAPRFGAKGCGPRWRSTVEAGAVIGAFGERAANRPELSRSSDGRGPATLSGVVEGREISGRGSGGRFPRDSMAAPSHAPETARLTTASVY
jgi:hypothetical protein